MLGMRITLPQTAVHQLSAGHPNPAPPGQPFARTRTALAARLTSLVTDQCVPSAHPAGRAKVDPARGTVYVMSPPRLALLARYARNAVAGPLARP